MLRCRLLGHKWGGMALVDPDGRTHRYCVREQKMILLWPGWRTINRNMEV